jgi:Domain of unknown function (DUF4328)
MAESWVCGDCRSFNQPKSDRCYRCHVPRKNAEMTEASAAFTTAAKHEERTLAAQVERLGARYVATWPLAMVLIPLIAVATVTSVLQLQALTALVSPDGQLINDPADIDEAVRMTAISSGSFLLGVVVWSVWIARVVANVPALVARWPRFGWLAALLGAWIPIINIKRPFSVVREAVSQIAERPNGAVLVAAAWWLCILLWYFGSNIVAAGRVLGGNDPTVLQAQLAGEQFGQLFYVPAGIFAAGVVFSVERLQRQAIRRRTETVLMVDGTSPA